MKIKFGSDGLELNSKKYKGYNLSTLGIEVDKKSKEEPFETLEKLAILKDPAYDTADLQFVKTLEAL